MTPVPPTADVRMRGFIRRTDVDEAIAWLDDHLHPLETENVPLEQAAGRVLAMDIRSEVDVPAFARSMMDGFAVRAADTHGASPYNRLNIRIVGEVIAGESYDGVVGAAEAIQIMTGAPLPTGADAVLPVEKVEVEGDRLHAHDEVSPGKHVGFRGEDIAAGTVVLAQTRRLRPQDLGVLSSIGRAAIPAVRQPRVAVVVTGNELLSPGSPAEGSRIADANGPMLMALVRRDGGCCVNPERIGDDPSQILAAMRQNSSDLGEQADVVLISGGSSVGSEDHAPQLLAEHGTLAVHGIAMRPSSPAGFGLMDQRWVMLLPGNPVSCLCAYDFFAGRTIRVLGGLSPQWPYRACVRTLRRKLVSVVGRVDYARVKLVDDQVEPMAIGGASVLSSTTRADGFVIVDADSEGYPAGAEVKLYLYDYG